MKKVHREPQFVKHSFNRAFDELKKRRAFKKYQKSKRASEQNLNTNERKNKHLFDHQYKNYKRVVAPEQFSFISNPDGIAKFINILKEHYDKKKKVFVEMDAIKGIDYDAIVVLLSIMIRFKSRHIDFNGSFPQNKTAHAILRESGFFKYLDRVFKDEDRYSLNRENKIHTHAWKNVDPVLGAGLIEQASMFLWNEKRRCQGAQRTLLELMLNTNNHASLDGEGEKHWWLSINHRIDKQKVCFSFVDYGVGVFKSLESKNESSKFFGWAEKLKLHYQYGNNAELLKLILDGKLHEIMTGHYYRGKGLPGIKEAMIRNQISNLHIITNNVFANVSQNRYDELNHNFNGTFIYWELNTKNANCHG